MLRCISEERRGAAQALRRELCRGRDAATGAGGSTTDVIRQITPALEGVDVLPAATWDDALAHLQCQSPDGLIVSYSFDELRPFRLLHHLMDEGRHVPTILLRAVPVRLERTEEADIRQAYSALGVAEFVNYAEVERRSGRSEALQQLRRLVMNHLGLHP